MTQTAVPVIQTKEYSSSPLTCMILFINFTPFVCSHITVNALHLYLLLILMTATVDAELCNRTVLNTCSGEAPAIHGLYAKTHFST